MAIIRHLWESCAIYFHRNVIPFWGFTKDSAWISGIKSTTSTGFGSRQFISIKISWFGRSSYIWDGCPPQLPTFEVSLNSTQKNCEKNTAYIFGFFSPKRIRGHFGIDKHIQPSSGLIPGNPTEEVLKGLTRQTPDLPFFENLLAWWWDSWWWEDFMYIISIYTYQYVYVYVYIYIRIYSVCMHLCI